MSNTIKTFGTIFTPSCRLDHFSTIEKMMISIETG